MKPIKDRTPEDYRKKATEALELAKGLSGQKDMDEWRFLETMSRFDDLINHDIEECGVCYHQYVMAQVAREMLVEAGEFTDATSVWSDRAMERWQESKYFKLWREEEAAGRNPNEAFEARGWEP